MVEAEVMARWRQQLDELAVGKLLPTDGQRDAQKFIRMLLEHVIGLRPLYELK